VAPVNDAEMLLRHLGRQQQAVLTCNEFDVFHTEMNMSRRAHYSAAPAHGAHVQRGSVQSAAIWGHGRLWMPGLILAPLQPVAPKPPHATQTEQEIAARAGDIVPGAHGGGRDAEAAVQG